MPSVIINGPVGTLEGRYQAAADASAPIVLVLHPNPQFGGSMNNLVVYTLFTTFADAGFAALRFNYRGVGKSEGQFNADGSELNDAVAALQWLREQRPQAKECWVAGFSYGAMIALQLLVKDRGFAGFVAIAPPVSKYDFTFLDSCPAPGLFLHGSADSLIPEVGTLELVERLRGFGGDVQYRRIDGATHFFDNHQEILAREVRDYLSGRP